MQSRIYTWNPDWKTFQHLSLKDKIQQFKEVVEDAQEFFLKSAQPTDICFIVAPDRIFAPGSSDNSDTTYAYADKLYFEAEMLNLQKQLHEKVCVIASAIDYATEDKQHYKVTSFILNTSNGVESYDKKSATEAQRDALIISETENYPPQPVTVSMHPGNKKNIFNFQGLKLGIEVCQDHEESILVNQRQTTDIHFLLTAGQTRRGHSINIAPLKKGYFVQVELEPKSNAMMNVDCRTLVAECDRFRQPTQTSKLNGHMNKCADFYRFCTGVHLTEVESQLIAENLNCYSITIQATQKLNGSPLMRNVKPYSQTLFTSKTQEVVINRQNTTNIDNQEKMLANEKEVKQNVLVKSKQPSCSIQ